MGIRPHFDLFKFTINESTVLCLLIVTAEAEKQLTSVLQIWSLAVTAVRDSRKYVTRVRSVRSAGSGKWSEGRGGDDEATAE